MWEGLHHDVTQAIQILVHHITYIDFKYCFAKKKKKGLVYATQSDGPQHKQV